MTDIVPAPDPPEPDTSGLAATIAAPGQDTRDPLVLRQGKVTAVTPGVGEASVCSVSIGGAAAIDNVRHLCDTPDVDDVVWLIQNGPDRLILGVVGGSDKAGTIKWIGGTGGAPNGWWPCDGRSTSGYPKLAARYGATIPDLRNRFIVASGTDYAVGATGGAATVTAVAAHTHTGGAHTHGGADHSHSTPAHSHILSATRYTTQTSHSHGGGPGGPAQSEQASNAEGDSSPLPSTNSDGSGTTGTAGASANTGSGGAVASASTGVASVDNRPPYYALLAIIKFG